MADPKSKPRAALADLCKRFAPNEKKVEARLTQALDDEARYKKRWYQRRSERNVEYEDVDLWLELVDALGVAGHACGIDWKLSAADIVGNLKRVLAKKKLPVAKLLAFYDEDAHVLTKAQDFIRFGGDALSAHGLALVGLAIDSDSYELTVLEYSELAAAQKSAKQLGGALVLHGPKTPRKTPLPAAKKKKVRKIRIEEVALTDDFPEGGFGFHPGLTFRDGKQTYLLDCTRWPPKQTKLGPSPLDVSVGSAGRRVSYSVFYKYENGAFAKRPIGTLLLQRSGAPDVELLDHVPDGFRPRGIGFVEELLVLLPEEATIRGGAAARPVVLNVDRLTGKTKMMREADELPRATPSKGSRREEFPMFLRQGFARTGTGRDVLVWESRAHLLKRGRFEPFAELSDVPLYDVLEGVPAPAGGFYYLIRSERKPEMIIREVSPDGSERDHVRVPYVLYPPRLGPDGALLMAVNRSSAPKHPLLIVWRPEEKPIEVPAAIFGVRMDDQARAYGFGQAGGETHVWIADRRRVKRAPYAELLEHAK